MCNVPRETPLSCRSGVRLLPAVLTCPHLSCPVPSRPVLSCPVLAVAARHAPWLHSATVTQRPVTQVSSRQTEGDVRASPFASVSVCLCPPPPPLLSPRARPGFGSVNPLLFFLPCPLLSFSLSLSWHQARLPSCSSTLSIAEVLLHGF